MSSELSITPQTKVGELLEAYPQIEEVLIGMAPAFEKLKNPVLRRTVARLVTLETAAGMAGLNPRELVAELRRAAGQPVEEEESAGDSAAVREADTPVWFGAGRIGPSIDADAMIARGETPLSRVLEEARGLEEGNILSVTVSFEPVPLVETLQKQGYQTFLRRGDSGVFELFVNARSA